MSNSVKTLLYPVTDLAAATEWYTTLIGEAPKFESPYYVGWQIDGMDIGLTPTGPQQGLEGPTPFWAVGDIHLAIKSLVDAGATVVQEPRDVGGGKLVGSVKDADGNVVGLTA